MSWIVRTIPGMERSVADATTAWQVAAALGEPCVVLAPGWRLVPGADETLALLAGRVLGDEVLLLDPDGEGMAVLASPAAAAALEASPVRRACEGGRTVDPPLAERDDPGARDLLRILRYDDAADPAWEDGPVEVGSDVLALPFWTPDFCATLVRAAEATGAFVPHPDDPVPGHEVSLASISPRLFAHVEDDLALRVVPAVRAWWPYIDYHGLRDAFVIKYALGEQEELRMHHDVAQLSASVKLNDTYEGAVLEFPRQGVTNALVPVGTMLVWPSLVTHPHRSTPLARGVKYSCTFWLELPGADA
jgi:hypothetical protein